MILKPEFSITPNYYHHYINLCPELELLEAFKNSEFETVTLLTSIPEEKHAYVYASGKWMVKELISHILDTERIMTYRALRFSRLDPAELAGFEENDYAPNSNCQERSLESMTQEYSSIRSATQSLFSYMNESMLDYIGTANAMKVSARMLGWMVTGHNRHHCNILKERYL
ncbi:MAG: DinB family protein [Bacteroidota bacterium]|nr:DinB family protein [Bacteroidota bacterium]